MSRTGLRIAACVFLKICSLVKILHMKKEIQKHGSNNAVYAIGMIGAAVYYISTASGFWMGLLGLLKSFVWPAFLVYEALKQLGA